MIVALYGLPVFMQRMLAAALFGILLFVPLMAAFNVCVLYSDRSEEILSLRERLGTLESIVEKGSQLDHVAQVEEANGFLATASEASLKADLQTRIKSYADGSGFKIQSLGGAPQIERDGIFYIGIRLTGQGTYKSLIGFVQKVEASLPYLLFEDASLRQLQSRAVRNGEDAPELSVQLSIYGALEARGS